MAEYELDVPGQLDPDFYLTHVEGKPPKYTSAYEASLHLLTNVSKVHADVTGASLIRERFEEARPPEFSIFNKPTKKAYTDFVEVASKIFVDNLSYKAFPGIERDDKGSITLFEGWLVSKAPASKDDISTVIKTLRDLRDDRSGPSHNVSEAGYDPAYYERQKAWITRIYDSMVILDRIYRTEISPEPLDEPWWFDRPTRFS